MKRETYIAMTSFNRRILSRLPGGEKVLLLPTYLCAAVYLGTVLHLFIVGDDRLWRAILVPAVNFLVVTALRPTINRQRPYDAFGAAPIGRWKPGKGKSMPSRHAVSAAAIAAAVVYVFPTLPVAAAMGLLAMLIASLRVLTGQHYPSDAAAALVLAAVLSWIGYTI